jgi:sugar phosphate isomerase/epimerase
MFNEILSKISYHAVYDDSIMDALKYAKSNGFAGIQVAIETPHLSYEKLSSLECQEIRDFASDHNLSISLHAPDDSVSMFETSKYLRQGIMNYYNALFDFAETVGCKIITIHIGSMIAFPTDTERRLPAVDLPLYKDVFQENINELLEVSGNSFIICVENYKTDDIILNLLQPYLNDSRIFLCWDLAKTYNSTMKKNIELEEYFLKNVDCIRQVHLHDINSQGRSHRIIGTGIIDFRYFLSVLHDKNIMDYCIEVRPRENAKESLDNLILLLQKDTEIKGKVK